MYIYIYKYKYIYDVRVYVYSEDSIFVILHSVECNNFFLVLFVYSREECQPLHV